MKLCSFIILAAFKFGVMDPIRQIAKLKSSPKFQRIRYVRSVCVSSKQLSSVHFVVAVSTNTESSYFYLHLQIGNFRKDKKIHTEFFEISST